jgi:transcriptional regulator GlxA family with amidase domain
MAEFVGSLSLQPSAKAAILAAMSGKRATDTALPRRVVVLVFPGFQILDAVGPIEVLNAATRLAAAGHSGRPGYRIEVVGPQPGPVTSSNRLAVVVEHGLAEVRGDIDTLIIAGGLGTRRCVQDADVIAWVRRAAARSRRVTSVCTGALLLAEAGLLDGKRATTHWAFAEELAGRYPKVHVDADPIYLKEGRFYTSAGVTSGMDLALALVEEDLGREIALATARWLVLFLKRPGGQAQFSAQLSAQTAAREPIRDLQWWILEHLDEDLSVEALAARAGMSPRNFARVFTREVGATPARYVERIRVDAARRQLEESSASIDQVADICGFGTAETMRRAFLRNVRVPPADYRNRFRTVH